MATGNSANTLFKRLRVRAIFGGNKIIVASTGRSGSSMLFDAIADSLIKHKFRLSPSNIIAKKIKRLCAGYVNRINTLPEEVYFFCKTHDVYKHPPKTNYKFIFVYGDPLDSVMSVERVVNENGQEWFALHQYHLGGSGAYGDLYERDVLNYQGQLESWLGQSNSNVICIDYDDLWDEKERLSKFLGFNVDLPPRRPRKYEPAINRINTELFTKLRELKDRLKKKYRSSIRQGP